MNWQDHIKIHRINQDQTHAGRVLELVQSMTMPQKFGQMIQAEIAAVTPEQAGEAHLGSILNGGGSFPHGDRYASTDDWVALADAFYDATIANGGIPIIWGTDAVHGHSNVYGATLFPHNIGLGASRNSELLRRIGEATAIEVAATGIDWTFAPTLAIPQDARWGRAYEAYSQSSTIVRECGKATIKGIQGDNGGADIVDKHLVMATSKHFMGEGGTTDAIDQGDTVCDLATLIDIHAQGHFAALEAGAQIVMAAFNSWNGEKVHAHRYLLTEVLKENLGFAGFVVSDWSGFDNVSHNLDDGIERCVNAGIDMLMVAEDWRRVLVLLEDLVEQGRISEERINDAVSRILRVKAICGLLDAPKPSLRRSAVRRGDFPDPSHKKVAQQAVRESLVLLKNQANLLPLKKDLNVLLLGPGADNLPMQCGGWSLTWQGVDTSNADFPHGSTLYEGIRARVEPLGGSVAMNVPIDSGVFDVAIVAFGEEPYAEGEGDIHHLGFGGGQAGVLSQLDELNRRGIPVVSVFFTGRPLWVNPELNRSGSFVVAWLPGTEGGVIADLLFARSDGETELDFVGRLPFVWPRFPDLIPDPNHDDSQKNLYPIGYGLTMAQISPDQAHFYPEAHDPVESEFFRRDLAKPRGTTYGT